jgi:dynein light intermediate chain 2
VGARGSGKSTLLNRILYPNETATPKPTDGVEYSYLRKSAPNSDRKDVANIWEISGADELCADFTASENLFLGMRQVSFTSLCFTSLLLLPHQLGKTRSISTCGSRDGHGRTMRLRLQDDWNGRCAIPALICYT